MVFDGAGNLYGTSGGGAHGSGIVFELSPVGTHWTETVLYSFCAEGGACDVTGAAPLSGLIIDKAGNLYGTTWEGGPAYSGTVFELSPSGNDWTYQQVYDLGSHEAGLTMDSAGNIFGVLVRDVVELSPNGEGGWNPTVIYEFGGRSRLLASALVLDSEGDIYGEEALTIDSTTRENVYKLSLVTKGKKKGEWKKKVLYSFDEIYYSWPGIVFDAAGNIYGVAYGDNYTGGIIFELVSNGDGGYQEKLLWNFDGTDGADPVGGPILDSAGNLYGATYRGGLYGGGVVFEVTP
jgi:uncharacterized repeat protein (TIGR03803 family)